MAKNRDKQKDNKRTAAQSRHEEQRLNLKTEWGISDPTPRLAVDNIIRNEAIAS